MVDQTSDSTSEDEAEETTRNTPIVPCTPTKFKLNANAEEFSPAKVINLSQGDFDVFISTAKPRGADSRSYLRASPGKGAVSTRTGVRLFDPVDPDRIPSPRNQGN